VGHIPTNPTLVVCVARRLPDPGPDPLAGRAQHSAARG
jgi:hypothetical protein